MFFLRRVLWQLCIATSIAILFSFLPNSQPESVKAETQNYSINGMVYVNGQPVWDGFTVRITGSRGTTLTANTGGGWFQFNGFPNGTYTIGHYHNCSSNTPTNVYVNGGTSRFDIYINCPTYNLGGHVYINGKPAHRGFGVRAKLGNWRTSWATIDNDSGWYEFKGDQALIAGTYEIGHNHGCSSNMPVNIGVPVSNNRGPDIWIDCPIPKYTVWGRVMINGKASHDGFGVRFKNKDTGQEYWPKVSGGDGWYNKEGVEEGWYTITHWQECPGNNNFDFWVGENSTTAPEINLTCPKPKYEIWGIVKIDWKPAHDGFGIRLKNKETGQEYWPKVEGGEGWYYKSEVEEGTYLVTHYHDCPGNNNFEFWVGNNSQIVPEINLTCSKPTYTVWGRVLIDGKPSHDGFGVRFKNKDTGQEYWPKVSGGDGWYNKEGIEEGTYVITHYHDCPGNNNFEMWVGENSTTAPEINLTCPKTLYDMVGNVYIDGQKAHRGFALRLWIGDDGRWAEVDDNGVYWFSQVPAGEYGMEHWACGTHHSIPVYVPGNISGRLPDIYVDCPKPKYEVWGRVMIDGKPGHDGFGVRLKNTKTGQEYWPTVSGGDGWYNKPEVLEGTYLVTHYHECPGNNNFEVWIGENSQTVPEITLTCNAPKAKHTVSGIVTIDGKPAHQGFGVHIDGIGWNLINNNEGRYTFTDVPEGMYTVRHNYNLCPTTQGNPQQFNVDGRAGPDFSIVCPKVDPVPPTPEPQPEPTCSEILQGLGLYQAVASSVMYEDLSNIFIPLILGNTEVTTPPQEPSPTYVMDEDTFLRFATKLDDMEQFITTTVVLSNTVLVFDHEKARASGFEQDLIDFTNQLISFENELLLGGAVSTAQIASTTYSTDGYPLVSEYMAAATRYANAPKAANVLQEVRGLSVEQCVCGHELFPRPNQAGVRIYQGTVDNDEAGFAILSSLGYHDSKLGIKIGGFQVYAWWTKPQTWSPEYCGIETYRDEGYLEEPNNEGKRRVMTQEYGGIAPRGEPNPELGTNPWNWPYIGWPVYVSWWHDNY